MWKFATIEMLGDRKEQQDDHIYAIIEHNRKRYLIAVVADGHGPDGAMVAEHVVKSLVQNCREHIADAINNFDRWAQSAFLDAHNTISPDKAENSGAAVMVVLQEEGNPVGRYAHAGNCRLIFLREDWARLGTFVLGDESVPHMPDRDANEAHRLCGSGATFTTSRGLISDGRHQLTVERGGKFHKIEMTRALGDTRFDPHLLHEPTTNSFFSGDGREFAIIATDGFWECFDDPERMDELKKMAGEAKGVEDFKSKLELFLAQFGTPPDNTTALIIEKLSQKDPASRASSNPADQIS